MQLDNIRNCKRKQNKTKKKKKRKENKTYFWLQKIEYNLTKQKYFECKIYKLHIA